MKTVGIICELNPMHKGHEHLVREVRSLGYDTVVAVMAGPFVQRGTPALCDKYLRAKIACERGFDLCFELPQCTVLQGAHYYARGAVFELSKIKGLQAIAFGVEGEGGPQKLLRLQEKKNRTDWRVRLGQAWKEGSSYRRSMEAALQESLTPNLILGLEYLEAMREFSLSYQPLPIPRTYLRGEKGEAYSPSAGILRSMLVKVPREALPSLFPEEVSGWETLRQTAFTTYQKNPPFREDFEPLFSFLKYGLLREQFQWERCPGYEPGLRERMDRAIAEGNSVREIIEKASNKRHSKSRIRRLLLTEFLNIHRQILPSYLRVLAFNERGRQLLRLQDCPLVQKPARARLEGEDAHCFAMDCRAQRLQEALNGLPEGLDYAQRYFTPSS